MDVSTGQIHDQVSQDWQSSKSTIAERAKRMLMTGLYADCQFLVGAHGSNQEVSILNTQIFTCITMIVLLNNFYFINFGPLI